MLGAALAALCALAGAVGVSPSIQAHDLQPQPPAGRRFGFSEGFALAAVPPAPAARLVAAAGGNTARMPVQWWGLEPRRGRWSEPVWQRYRRAYTAFTARGIRPHLTLTHAPPWARDPAHRGCTARGSCNYPPSREMLGEWRELVQEVARRFPRATIEVWNEPNFFGSWRSGVDPARYMELLAAARRAAAGVGSVRVLMGGLGSSTKANSLTPAAFLDAAYRARPSLRGRTPALNIHVYPGRDLTPNGPLARALRQIRSVRRAHGDASTPIFVTELGASTSGPRPFSEPEQAAILTRATRELLAMPDVAGVLISRLLEDPRLAESDPERGLGLLRTGPAGPRPKPAYCEFVRAAGHRRPGCARAADLLGRTVQVLLHGVCTCHACARRGEG